MMCSKAIYAFPVPLPVQCSRRRGLKAALGILVRISPPDGLRLVT